MFHSHAGFWRCRRRTFRPWARVGYIAWAILLGLGVPGVIYAELRSTLIVTVTDSPDPAPAKGTVKYNIAVRDEGPKAATKVVVTIPVPEGTTFVSCTADLGICEGPAAGTNGTLTADFGTIASGGSATITITVKVIVATGSTISNTVTATSTSYDPNPVNNSATITTVLRVNKSGESQSATQSIYAQGTAPVTLTNGTGDGSVQITVDGYGSFGSSTPAGDAFYDPIGPLGRSGTVYESGVYFSPLGNFLTTDSFGVSQPSVQFLVATSTLAQTGFDTSGFHIELTQRLNPVGPGGSNTTTTASGCLLRRILRSIVVNPYTAPVGTPSIVVSGGSA